MIFHAKHGVLPQEKLTGGDFRVSVVVCGNFAKACISDNVDDTVSYAELYEITKRAMQQPSALIENVAYRIGQTILDSSLLIDSVEVEVCKINPPMGAQSDGASIIINMTK